MLTTEEQGAIGRFTLIVGGQSEGKVYEHCGGFSDRHFARQADNQLLAKLLCRAFQPDDDELATHEWFSGFAYEWFALVGAAKGHGLQWVEPKDGSSPPVLSGRSGAGEFSVVVPPGSTVGQVRVFLEWQGVKVP